MPPWPKLSRPRATSGTRAPPASSMRSCDAASASTRNSARRSIAMWPCAPRIRAGSSMRSQADWGEQAEAILAANNQRPPFWIRVNRRAHDRCAVSRAPRGERHRSGGQHVRRRGAAARGRRRRRGSARVRRRRRVDSGRRRAARRAICSRREPGERILDACAAPGGKTGHLLELQPELAELVAVDVSSERLTRIADNLHRLGLSATLAAGDATEPAGWWDGRPFERILLDVPCSATGVIRRHPDIKLLRRPDDIAALAARQLQLLRALWALLAPGGRLVYASCSALQAETVAVVEAFQGDRMHRRARRLPPCGSRLGQPAWTAFIMLA